MLKLKTINIAEINLTGFEEKAVLKVMRSRRIAKGDQISKFEKEFAKYIGCKYAITFNSGTSALSSSFLALGLKKGDQVITTSFSFIPPYSALLDMGLEIVFADIKQDYNLDEKSLRRILNHKAKAILPVHLFGNPCEIEFICNFAKKNHLFVIEDVSQAHGADIGGKKLGSFGDFGIFSFYATKNMTTGEGGMLTTNSKFYFEKARNLRERYSLRLTEIQASLGLVQLKKLDRLNQKRIKNARILSSLLKDVQGIILPQIVDGRKHVFHQFTIRILDTFPLKRDKLQLLLTSKGIICQVYYDQTIPASLGLNSIKISPEAEKFSKQVLSLPIHPGLSLKELKYIAKVIKNAV